MGRVLFVRLTDRGRADAAEWAGAVRDFASSREWRSEPMWLATEASQGLFEMEYLRHLRVEAQEPVFGAGFIRLLRLTARHGGRAVVTDPANPIRKQRQVAVVEGQVSGPRSIDEVMVSGPIFKRLPADTITFYPPRYWAATLPGPESPPGWWSFAIQGMRARARGFLEAEAEAMRIYRSLRAIG